MGRSLKTSGQASRGRAATAVRKRPKRGFRSRFGKLERERLVGDVLAWVHEASNPYYDWFHGGTAPAREALARAMRRPSSEMSVTRLTVLLDGDRPIGGMIALEGAELERCRRADALAAARELEDRQALRQRIAAGQELFAPVEPDQFYLSRIGVIPEVRKQGVGVRILRRFLQSGSRRGFRRFRLDVSAENEAALRLYRAYGFEIAEERTSETAAMTYLAMTLDRISSSRSLPPDTDTASTGPTPGA